MNAYSFIKHKEKKKEEIGTFFGNKCISGVKTQQSKVNEN